MHIVYTNNVMSISLELFKENGCHNIYTYTAVTIVIHYKHKMCAHGIYIVFFVSRSLLNVICLKMCYLETATAKVISSCCYLCITFKSITPNMIFIF